MAKVKVSQIFKPQTVLTAVSDLTDNKAEQLPYSLETPVKAMKMSKKEVKEEDEGSTVKSGRPPKLSGGEKRVNFNTNIRKSFILAIKKMAFERDVTNADILDEIISHYLDTYSDAYLDRQ